MVHVWNNLAIDQFRRGIGNLTKKAYGNIGAGTGKDGVLTKNRKISVFNISELEEGMKKRFLFIPDHLAKSRIKKRAEEFKNIKSHV